MIGCLGRERGRKRKRRKEESELFEILKTFFFDRKKKEKHQKPKNSPSLLERPRPDQEVGPRARDEPESVVSRLRVLPELHVAVVEDVGVRVEVVEALRF